MKKLLVPFCLTLIIFIGSAGVSWGADSQKVGPFDKYHENGKLALKATWKDGKWEGPFERYYENGRLESKGTYKDGKQDGIWVGFNRDGTPKNSFLTGTFNNGKKISD